MMKPRDFSVLLCGAGVAAILSGCAAYETRGVPAESSSAMRAADGMERQAPMPEPEARPGLGTSWGETRRSEVRSTEFVRADPRRPDGRLSIYYNDRAGFEALAPGWRRGRSPMLTSGPLGVEIRGRGLGGGRLPTHRVNGRDYVIGRDGQRYAIVLHNPSGRRVEAVVSVDGLDVLDGREASLSKRGYSVPAGGRLVIDGWRRGMSSVAAFEFGSVASSYAARKHGDTRNVGVIGVAAFSEKTSGGRRWAEPPDDDWSRRHRAEPFPAR